MGERADVVLRARHDELDLRRSNRGATQEVCQSSSEMGRERTLLFEEGKQTHRSFSEGDGHVGRLEVANIDGDAEGVVRLVGVVSRQGA